MRIEAELERSSNFDRVFFFAERTAETVRPLKRGEGRITLDPDTNVKRWDAIYEAIAFADMHPEESIYLRLEFRDTMVKPGDTVTTFEQRYRESHPWQKVDTGSITRANTVTIEPGRPNYLHKI